MGFVVPIINKEYAEVRERFHEWVKQEKIQKRLVLVIVCVALLLDNMLYMVIVPIIPKYLRAIGAYEQSWEHVEKYRTASGEFAYNHTDDIVYEGEDAKLGMLFASKALLQLLINPFSGALIDRIGYEVPMIIGLTVMFLSTSIFALGQSYGVLFFARCIQGLGSAFADTSGLAMIADRFSEENERSTAMGVAIAFISFGSLVAPPFGGSMYDHFGKSWPFILLALVCLIDAFMVFMVIHPKIRRTTEGEKLQGTPIWRLFMDPYIALCAGGLVMANISLAFLEPTIGTWMMDTMGSTEYQQGIVWLPAFLPHVGGVYFTIWFLKRYPQATWLLAIIGLALEGVSCFIIPFCKAFGPVILPLSILCFGIALIDTSILPMLGYLVDTRHVSVYGSVYAIADISYSAAYAIAPMFAGGVVGSVGFLGLNMITCFSNLLYTPVFAILRHVYSYSTFAPAAELNEYKGDLNGQLGEGKAIAQEAGYGYGMENAAISQYQVDATQQQQSAPRAQQYAGQSVYQAKVKAQPGAGQMRAFRDTDAILGGDEDEEEFPSYQARPPPPPPPPQQQGPGAGYGQGGYQGY